MTHHTESGVDLYFRGPGRFGAISSVRALILRYRVCVLLYYALTIAVGSATAIILIFLREFRTDMIALAVQKYPDLRIFNWTAYGVIAIYFLVQLIIIVGHATEKRIMLLWSALDENERKGLIQSLTNNERSAVERMIARVRKLENVNAK